jgi:hypothetical protein
LSSLCPQPQRSPREKRLPPGSPRFLSACQPSFASAHQECERPATLSCRRTSFQHNHIDIALRAAPKSWRVRKPNPRSLSRFDNTTGNQINSAHWVMYRWFATRVRKADTRKVRARSSRVRQKRTPPLAWKQRRSRPLPAASALWSLGRWAWLGCEVEGHRLVDGLAREVAFDVEHIVTRRQLFDRCEPNGPSE